MVIEYKYFKIPKIKFLTTALLNKKPGCDESSFMWITVHEEWRAFYICPLIIIIIILILVRCGRAVYHCWLAQGPVECVLRSACKGAEEEGHSDCAPGRQVQHDNGTVARVLHETK